MTDYPWLTDIWQWMQLHLFSVNIVMQCAAMMVIAVLCKRVSRSPKEKLNSYIEGKWQQSVRDKHNEEALVALVFPTMLLLGLWGMYILSTALDVKNQAIEVAAKLLLAWVLIRLMSSMVRVPAFSKLFAACAWGIAALSIVELLVPVMELLDGFALTVGDSRFSLLGAVKGTLSVVILLWVAGVINRLVERKIAQVGDITPSVRVLLSKISKIVLIGLALLIGLQSLGVDLTSLQIFGGAIGLGLGFGLQKVISNLVCGVILLLDKSVKPGDVIELDDTYGEVNALGARCVSVLTRDGVEYLIPNEDLITQRVTNWSYSSKHVRLKLPVGISYQSDVKKAMQIMDEIAGKTPRVLTSPAPATRMIAFGQSAIELELRIWIEDPEAGVRNVRSAILLDIWERFQEEEIELPFVQRDVHLKPSPELRQWMGQGRSPETVEKD